MSRPAVRQIPDLKTQKKYARRVIRKYLRLAMALHVPGIDDLERARLTKQLTTVNKRLDSALAVTARAPKSGASAKSTKVAA